jgi:hypothetical protein
MKRQFEGASRPPSIKYMDYQWCSCGRREKGTPRLEMKAAADHNEEEQK